MRPNILLTSLTAITVLIAASPAAATFRPGRYEGDTLQQWQMIGGEMREVRAAVTFQARSRQPRQVLFFTIGGPESRPARGFELWCPEPPTTLDPFPSAGGTGDFFAPPIKIKRRSGTDGVFRYSYKRLGTRLVRADSDRWNVFATLKGSFDGPAAQGSLVIRKRMDGQGRPIGTTCTTGTLTWSAGRISS